MTRIYEYLDQNNIDVYFIGQHLGDCISPYVVIKDDAVTGQNDSNKIGSQLVDIIFYSPQNQYTKLQNLKATIKNLLKAQNYLRYTGSETGTITDDSVKGLTCSVMYEILKEL